MALADIYFDASYGGVDLLVASLETRGGRDIVVQSPSNGDQHTLDDRGRKHLETRVTILFIHEPGKDAPLDRFDRLRLLVEGEDGKPAQAQIFSHPILGSYRARISDFDARASADETMVEVQATVLAEDEPHTVFSAGGGVTGEAGFDVVNVASKHADTQLAAVGLASPVPSSCLTAVTSWSSADPNTLDSNEVIADVATLTAAIAVEIDTLELAAALSRWQAYQAMMVLSFQLGEAAKTFTRAADRMFELLVTRAQPVLSICARIYGAALALDMRDQVVAINRVRRPGLVPAGTRLLMPSDGASP
jgi:hypothetical protein